VTETLDVHTETPENAAVKQNLSVKYHLKLSGLHNINNGAMAH